MEIPPFRITAEIENLVAEISARIGDLNALMEQNLPHPQLRKENRIRTIHSSLAIENNSLSVEQVTAIVEGKRVLGPPAEVREVISAINAYEILPQIDAFSERDLLLAHEAMMQDLVRDNGRYRSKGVGVFDENRCVHMAPPAFRVPTLMRELFEWVRTTETHPLISSCVFHYEFEFIHPFSDGNGRMGRLWQTALLSRWKAVFAWLPVETIVKENQKEYYAAIHASDDSGESTAFILFMLKCIKQTIEEIVI